MMRINATKNISKITQSMKMVSAAKLRGDQARLAQAQPFNVSASTDLAANGPMIYRGVFEVLTDRSIRSRVGCCSHVKGEPWNFLDTPRVFNASRSGMKRSVFNQVIFFTNLHSLEVVPRDGDGTFSIPFSSRAPVISLSSIPLDVRLGGSYARSDFARGICLPPERKHSKPADYSSREE